MSIIDKNSPDFHVLTYRNPETIQREEVLDEFMSWIQYDYESVVDTETLNDLQELINQFVGYDIDKVKEGEKQMLMRWKGFG